MKIKKVILLWKKKKQAESQATAGKRPFMLYFLLGGLILLLGSLQVVFANKLATSGKILNNLEQEAKALESENRQLETEIAARSSLDFIKEKAEELGFDQEIAVANLTSQKEVALKY